MAGSRCSRSRRSPVARSAHQSSYRRMTAREKISVNELDHDVKKATAHSAGTAITPQSADSDNPALPAEVTVRTAGTVTEGALLFPLSFNNDEAGATMAFPSTQLLAATNWLIEGPEVQGYRLREGEGFTVKQITSSTVGQFAWLLVFTVDDDA